MGCFDSSFVLNLVDAFVGGVQSFSRSRGYRFIDLRRYDTVLLFPSVRQSPIAVAVGCFDRSFDLNLVDAFVGGVQG